MNTEKEKAAKKKYLKSKEGRKNIINFCMFVPGRTVLS